VVLGYPAPVLGALGGAALPTAALGLGGGLLLLLLPRRPAVPAAAADPGPPARAPAWQEQALAATLAALPDGVAVLGEDDRVLLANEPARELLGLAAGAAAPVGEVVDWPQLEQALRGCRQDRAVHAFEAPRDGRDGPRTVEVAVSAVAGGGRCVVVLRDLSRLRRLETMRRDFVANVGHELKTPLAAIQGFVETLLDDPDVPPPTRQRFLQRVQRQVERLARLVADLLTLSRLDEHLPGPAEPCELAAVVREVARDLQPLADRQQVSLCTGLPDGPVWVAAERESLRQVVSNLVDNAIKYTPAGGSVTVGLGRNGARAALDVTDTGIGLGEPDQQRVFERFYRVDPARSSELGGTGLGLSIVKNTVQGLGGEVGVRSRLGQGSTFWVRLPLAGGGPGPG
jgi:two-component system phosphate regulon sensor histidine kinase PhoR